MNEAARSVKIVEWSDEGNCYEGSCPGLFYGGCHGDDEQQVFADLRSQVEEITALCAAEERELPSVTCGRDFANRLLQV